MSTDNAQTEDKKKYERAEDGLYRNTEGQFEEQNEKVKKFRKLGLPEEILTAIDEMGFDEPTEIQEKAVPLAVKGEDIIGMAATGSGKTLAFGAAIIHNTKPGNGIQALVLTPTRELAEQVKDALVGFSKFKRLKIAVVYGGVSITRQIQALKSADVVVATPGRLLDHMGRETVHLFGVKTLVLDEADRMLDMGFLDDVEKIIRACPKERQTLLFSATLPSSIRKLSESYMRTPKEAFAESYVDPSKLEQIYYDVPSRLKYSLLVHLLRHEKAGLVMVFCNTRRYVDILTKNLNRNGIDAMALHGGLTQNNRSKTLGKFHSEHVSVLICTDVAARGLDIPHVSHIYNYDIPKESKQYIHRIGRTARAGKDGIVINILSEKDHENFQRVLRDNEIDVIRTEMPYVEEIRLEQGRRRDSGRGRPGGRSGGSGGRRDGKKSSSSRGRSKGSGGSDRHKSRGGGDRHKSHSGSDHGNRSHSEKSHDGKSHGGSGHAGKGHSSKSSSSKNNKNRSNRRSSSGRRTHARTRKRHDED